MLPSNMRLRKKAEYKTVFDSGKSYAGKYIVLITLKCLKKTALSPSFSEGDGRSCTKAYKQLRQLNREKKIGFIASKKVGNSVIRNRAKRLMREVIRLHMSEIIQDVQIIFIARSTIKGVSYSEVEKAILQTLQKAKLLNKKA